MYSCIPKIARRFFDEVWAPAMLALISATHPHHYASIRESSSGAPGKGERGS
jgi:hypothetical protein